jgi:hypothetical protein
MKILSVLSGRYVGMSGSHKDYATASDKQPPSGITAVTFVITTADTPDDRFVAYAINASLGRVEYTVEGHRAQIPSLTKFFTNIVELTGTVVGPGPLPPPPGGDDETPLLVRPGPDGEQPGHPVVALARIIHEVFASIEQLPARPVL